VTLVSECTESSRLVDNWSEDDETQTEPVLDTSDVNERLSVCLQLADARQPPDHRAKIVRLRSVVLFVINKKLVSLKSGGNMSEYE